MDSPSVQSSSKCSGSDFSIKRILSDPPRQALTEPPSWLCCTRYQPPRLPRSGNTMAGSRARRSGRHARVPFTGAQAAALEAAYARAPYLAPPALRALAAALQLRDDRIKIWFQNRRARERREKTGNVTPPRAMTLQPTTVARIPSPRNLHQAWNRFQPPVGHITPRNYEHRALDSLSHSLASNMTSESTCPGFLCSKQSFSSSSENLSLDNNRCESPLDIETIDI